MTRGIASSLLALPILLSAGVASAQDAARIEGDRRFAEGVRLYEDGEYADALREFEASRGYRETASVTYNIANTLKALGRRVDAINAYRRFMEIKAERLTAAEREDTERLIADLLSRVVQLTVRTDPPDANVLVNGWAVTEMPMLLDVGTDVVAEGRKEGFRSARTQTRLTSPGPFELTLTLERDPEAGRVALTAAPGNPDDRGAPEGATRPDGPTDEEEGGSMLPWILGGAAAVAIGGGIAAYFLFKEDPGPAVAWRVTTP